VSAAWVQIDLAVEIEAPLEVRAEPDGDGGWRIRPERSQGGAGTTLFGWLQAGPQDYAIRVGGAIGTQSGNGA
jgi:hypothetical protein